MTPFHNMALMCPATAEADVDALLGGVLGGGLRAGTVRPASRAGELAHVVQTREAG